MNVDGFKDLLRFAFNGLKAAAEVSTVAARLADK